MQERLYFLQSESKNTLYFFSMKDHYIIFTQGIRALVTQNT